MKVTLNDVGSLIDATTAATTINANSATIETAFDNTLSLDGTSPNQMQSELDMNSKQIINLPNPATANSPLRLQDLNTFIGGGTITNIPSGGTTGQVLKKNSNANYDIGFSNSVTSVGLAMPADLTVTNSPVTTTGTLTGAWATTPTGTGAMVRATGPTISAPVITGHPVIENTTSTGATGSGKFVFDTSPTIVTPTVASLSGGAATNSSLTLKSTTNGAPSGDVTNVLGTTVNLKNSVNVGTTVNVGGAGGGVTFNVASAGDGLVAFNVYNGAGSKQSWVPGGGNTTVTFPAATGTLALGTAGQYPGETTNGNATAGNIGEYVESVVVSGSAVALVTGTAKTVTSISLTAGDWDVDAIGYIAPAATTNVTNSAVSISGTTNTFDGTPGKANGFTTTGVVTGGPSLSQVIPPYRLSLSATTTVFLICQAVFTISTASAFGIIRARRAR